MSVIIVTRTNKYGLVPETTALQDRLVDKTQLSRLINPQYTHLRYHRDRGRGTGTGGQGGFGFLMVQKAGEEVEEEEVKEMRLGKYEVGRTLGEGNFGKVKYARDVETGRGFAVKILEKSRIINLKITDQVISLPGLTPFTLHFL